MSQFSMNKTAARKADAPYDQDDLTGRQLFDLDSMIKYAWVRLDINEQQTLLLQCNNNPDYPAVRVQINRNLLDSEIGTSKSDIISPDAALLALSVSGEAQPFQVGDQSTDNYVIIY